jgi:hypothetical protein
VTLDDVDESGDTVLVVLTFDARSSNAPPVTLTLTTAFRIRDGLVAGLATAPTAAEAKKKLAELSP